MKTTLKVKVESKEEVKRVKTHFVELPFGVGDIVQVSGDGKVVEFRVMTIEVEKARFDPFLAFRVEVGSATSSAVIRAYKFVSGDKKLFDENVVDLDNALKNVKVLTSSKK